MPSQELVTIVPNPAASGRITVQTTIAEAIDAFTIRIVITTGQTMATLKVNKPAGVVNIPVDISFRQGAILCVRLPAGQTLATSELHQVMTDQNCGKQVSACRRYPFQ